MPLPELGADRRESPVRAAFLASVARGQGLCSGLHPMKTTGSLDGCQVLVVEDDTDSRNAIRETLEVAGATVSTAATAGDALAALAARRYDVVVSDLAMPQQSGFWLITKIRQLYPDRPIPVLAVTGHPFPADGVRRASSWIFI